MKNLSGTCLLLACLLLLGGCSRPISRLFSKPTPHEACAERLRKSGADKTPAGKQWFFAAENALQQPVAITLPYAEAGRYQADRPVAAGFRFLLARGQALTVTVNKPADSPAVFLELWEANGPAARLLVAVDTAADSLHYTADAHTNCILRLQPLPGAAGSYALRLSGGPSFGFPVAGKAARIGSFWGADRDGGARSHEGIDIFAARGTPALAVAAGHINRVETTPIGGKVVWLRPEGRPWSVYYAHLDEQLVQPGQAVRRGDTLGRVGNTGNAIHTSPHLHFGIYGLGGAVDPLLFVKAGAHPPLPALPDTTLLAPAAVQAGNHFLHTTPVATDAARRKLTAGMLVYPEARSGEWLRVRLADSSTGFLRPAAVRAKPAGRRR